LTTPHTSVGSKKSSGLRPETERPHSDTRQSEISIMAAQDEDANAVLRKRLYDLVDDVKGKLPELQALLEQNPEVHPDECRQRPDGRGTWPLHIASTRGDTGRARLLIEHKADVNFSGYERALSTACRGGHIECARLLIEHTADVNFSGYDTALSTACRGGHIECARLLIEHKADVNFFGHEPALSTACRDGHIECARLLIEHKADVNFSGYEPALSTACRDGHIECARLLIEHKADVHANYGEALQNAIDGGHRGCVKLLLQLGVKMTGRHPVPLQVLHMMYDYAMYGGYCVSEAQKAKLDILLEEFPPFDVDAAKDEDSGRTALDVAVSYDMREPAQLLIDHKADVNATRNDLSVLHWAVMRNSYRCAELLLQNGAGVNGGSCSLPPLLSGDALDINMSQMLLDYKADISYTYHVDPSPLFGGYGGDRGALSDSMRPEALKYTPGLTFAVLSCNTDAKNVHTDVSTVTPAVRDAHIDTYQHVQGYIDEYHRILKLVLSEHVQVDRRVGLTQNGIYQEPLERTLEYLGLSMSKDQVVNTSIDGEGVRRALIPGHLLNADLWFELAQKERLAAEEELLGAEEEETPSTEEEKKEEEVIEPRAGSICVVS
jgi:ankyrin repeat protein